MDGGRRYAPAAMPVSKKRKKVQERQQTVARTEAKPSVPESPSWYAPVMFGLMALGVVTVVATYIFQLPNTWLLPGLTALAVGMFMTMGYK